MEAAYPVKADQVEVIDYFGQDEALAHLCFAAAGMLEEQVSGDSKRISSLVGLLAEWLVEKYTDASVEKSDFRGGLPIWQLRKVEDHVRLKLAEDISVEMLAGLVELTPFIFPGCSSRPQACRPSGMSLASVSRVPSSSSAKRHAASLMSRWKSATAALAILLKSSVGPSG